MICRRVAIAALLFATLAVPAPAQDTVDVNKQDTVDVSRLPVNLDRIQRQLRQTAVRAEREGLNLRYMVDVYGRAPRIELFAPQPNLMTGPTPYGAPTHRQMIEAVTPQEYRAPAADFGALFRWLADKANDKSRR
jgi:hypothetical protein